MNRVQEPPRPSLDTLKRQLLELARARSLEELLTGTVRRLADRPPVALARIWLLRPGDLCPECPLQEACADRERCLHLVASAGSPEDPGAPPLDRPGDGGAPHHHRLPLGLHEAGRVASTRDAVVVRDGGQEAAGLSEPDWARARGLRGFLGQPLVDRGELLGVLAVYARGPVPAEGVAWLRILADHLAAAIGGVRALEDGEKRRHRLELECTSLRREVHEARVAPGIAPGPGAGIALGILGESAASKALDGRVDAVAPMEASVLVRGEPGTEMELVAREIHRRSPRADAPFVRIDCALAPEDLAEAGRLELADGGTLFLDEVGALPLELQDELLCVLPEGPRCPDSPVPDGLDARVIAATSRDLKAEVQAGRFRRDLFYRLSTFPLEVGPLRERPEDVVPLALHLARAAARRHGRPEPRLTKDQEERLRAHSWPGNVCELRGLVERAVLTSPDGELRFDVAAASGSGADAGSDAVVPEFEMRRRERENVRAALELTGWKVYGEDGAAALLGIKPTTLASRMKKMGLRRE